MNSQFLMQIKKAILSNPWTTFMAFAGLVALAIYSKTVTPVQAINLVITILTAAGAADGGKES